MLDTRRPIQRCRRDRHVVGFGAPVNGLRPELYTNACASKMYAYEKNQVCIPRTHQQAARLVLANKSLASHTRTLAAARVGMPCQECSAELFFFFPDAGIPAARCFPSINSVGTLRTELHVDNPWPGNYQVYTIRTCPQLYGTCRSFCIQSYDLLFLHNAVAPHTTELAPPR